eukprot:TRINITY_DN3529_c0_g2_i1.p2 TRINITY_DN3529_c0_g2~~TRINITY_DN3529_c0_g2_i1.p2  ORF type:complete len:295 (-),score=110.56 TRINITY_DN3529_c0_g2_i1:127-1011(-)
MFEQVLATVPATSAKMIYIMYADLEERFGLARHAMAIYDRATKHVPQDEKLGMYLIYIARATEFFGITKTREIFEQAITSLPDKNIKEMCLRYARLETSLGEIDRARALYVHASQFSDPRSDKEFWKLWYDFEVHHGNKDTFADMLRIKRSVQQKFNTQVNIMSAEMLAANKKAEKEEKAIRRKEELDLLEKESKALAKPLLEEISKHKEEMEQVSGGGRKRGGEDLEEMVKMADNPEEIDISEFGETEEAVDEVEVEEKMVPSRVFGSLASGEEGKKEKEKAGALERFKKKKT